MKEATHSLLQRGDHMRMLDAIHPSPICDMTKAYNSTAARTFCSDCKGGTISNNNFREGAGAICSPLCCKIRALQMKKLKYSWYVHQSNTCKNAK